MYCSLDGGEVGLEDVDAVLDGDEGDGDCLIVAGGVCVGEGREGCGEGVEESAGFDGSVVCVVCGVLEEVEDVFCLLEEGVFVVVEFEGGEHVEVFADDGD